MTQAAVATLGHNNPPADGGIEENLKERNGDLLADADSLLDDAVLVPEILTEQKQADDLTDLIKKINTCKGHMTDAHSIEKEPYLRGGQAVDAFFRKPIADLKAAADGAKKKITAFMNAEEAKRQAALRAEADRQRAIAEEQAANARKLEEEGKKDEAAAASKEAVKADKVAAKTETVISSGVSVARSSGSVGKASLRKTWVGEFIDDEAVDITTLWQFISAENRQKALDAYVKNGGRELAGTRIYEKSEAVVR